MKSSLYRNSSSLVLGLIAGAWANGAIAQQAGGEVSEVVVTGSFIAGTPEDAALPVDVIGADELQRQGNPSTVEMMKNLTVSSGIQGDQNGYQQAIAPIAGTATVNLRGLGPQRTLVLLNGRRLVNHPTRSGAVDLNVLPQAAIGRIEVLKDGAAATYGSDAIAGVVNFITRKNFEGLQIAGEVRYVPDAMYPDYNASALWGWTGERGDVLLSANWVTRGRLEATKRDWNLKSYTENPDAGYSFTNNPTSFSPVVGANTVSSQIRDPGCTAVGALAGFSGPSQVCLARGSGAFINYSDPMSRWQVYGEANFDLTESVNFHAEALYAETYIEQLTSPAFPSALGGPTGATSPFPGQYYVPASNPGLALLIQQFPTAFPAGTTGIVYNTALNFRPFGLGGNPLFGGDAAVTRANNKYYRISAGFSGKLFNDEIGWDLAATYNVSNYDYVQWDYLIYRQELALRGFGSLAGAPGCTAAVTANYTTNAGNNAVGCYYFNPFSNSFASNSPQAMERPGAANPLFNPAVANNIELVKWIWAPTTTDNTGRLFVVDGVLNGTLPIEFSGGKVGWAVGGQFRRNFYRTSFGPLNDASVTPCVDTPFTGTRNCLGANGPFSLSAASFPSNVVQNVYAAFAEVNLPLTEAIGVHIAARYENYGENAGGDTFNPKLDLRWQVSDWLALRGSVGTTFRAPPLPLLDPAPSVALISLANAFRAVSQEGNPDLSPEKATTYSVGAIVSAGKFKGTVDYWNFDFQDPFVTEPPGTLFNLMFPNNTNVNCGNPAFADLQSRFTFEPNTCGVANVAKLNTRWVNSGGVKTDGVDTTGEFETDGVLGGEARLGVTVSWIHKYAIAAQTLRGVVLAPAFDGVGKFNYNTGYFAIPQWKGNVYGEIEFGPHNIRIQTNYIDGYIDQRTTPFTGNLVFGDVPTVAQATILPRPQKGKKLDPFVTTDVTWRVFLPAETTAVFNINNIFDSDPPFARIELNYDAAVASAFGRTYKVSLVKKF